MLPCTVPLYRNHTGFNRLGTKRLDWRLHCRGWIDDDMVWEIPREERPSHVCNPWVWIPDTPITDVAVQIQTVDELMDHLRTIPRSVCLP